MSINFQTLPEGRAERILRKACGIWLIRRCAKMEPIIREGCMDVAFYQSALEFRTWLKKNHRTHSELWVGFHKKGSGKLSISYSEAVEEALCFGWIDGVKKSVSSSSYTHRFTPRKVKSKWSAINLARARQLIQAKRMRPAGRKAFESAQDSSRQYSYEQRDTATLTRLEQRQFQARDSAWQFFQSQPPWYQRTATWWVVSAKREETRSRRLAQLIGDSAEGRTIPPLTRMPPGKT